MKIVNFTNDYILLNFDESFNNDKDAFLSSKSFNVVFKNYYKYLKDNKHSLLLLLKGLTPDFIIEIYCQLVKYELKTVVRRNEKFTLDHALPLYEFTEGFFDYWRKLLRYGLLESLLSVDDKLTTYHKEFNDLILSTFRIITQKLRGESYSVNYEHAVGLNASMQIVKHKLPNIKPYSVINGIPFVTQIVSSTPQTINTKSNTPLSSFKPLTFSYNPLSHVKLSKSHFIAFPFMVGSLLAFIYIHRDYLHHGVMLSNLFTLIHPTKLVDQKPNLVFIFGVEEDLYDGKFYHDTQNDVYLAFLQNNAKNDYFGNLKNMILTLHNIYMINHDYLPVRGTMVQITLNSNKVHNVLLYGDNESGKSETLSALYSIANDEIKDIKTIFEDMGTLKLLEDKIVANGTERGAFLNLDQAGQGYAYTVLDKAIIVNPTLPEPKLVLPIISHEFITKNHTVDILLYVNNYDDKEGISAFKTANDAMKVFKKGTRKIKGINGEKALVSTYLVNPYGPLQYMKQTDILLPKYFNALKTNNVYVGEIYTKISLTGEELRGPRNAALTLLKLIKDKE